jgi:hypothetical protein
MKKIISELEHVGDTSGLTMYRDRQTHVYHIYRRRYNTLIDVTFHKPHIKDGLARYTAVGNDDSTLLYEDSGEHFTALGKTTFLNPVVTKNYIIFTQVFGTSQLKSVLMRKNNRLLSINGINTFRRIKQYKKNILNLVFDDQTRENNQPYIGYRYHVLKDEYTLIEHLRH